MSVIKQNGQELTNENDIQHEFIPHYTNLFATSTKAPHPWLHEIISKLPSLENDTTEKLNSSLDIQEIMQNITEIKSNKAPGPDELPASFYKK